MTTVATDRLNSLTDQSAREPIVSNPMAEARQEVSRREIVAAATKLFAEQGVRATSLATIAEAVGVTKAALYHYFASKQELVIETVRANLETFEAEVAPPWSERAGIDALEEALSRKIEQAEREQGLNLRFFYTVMLEQLDEPEVEQEFRRWFEEGRAQIRSMIEAGQGDGTFRTDVDLDALFAVIEGTAIGIDLLWLNAPDTVDLRAAYALALDQIRSTLHA